MHSQTIIGGLEDLNFPDWRITNIRARVDTGARTSCIHVENLSLLSRGRVQFYVVTGRRKPRRRHRVVTKIKKCAYVRPSTGKRVIRYVVETTMVLGNTKRIIELTLADRDKMQYRMLLGREALQHDFLVDPSRRCMLKPRRT
jgi:hypothetical protein